MTGVILGSFPFPVFCVFVLISKHTPVSLKCESLIVELIGSTCLEHLILLTVIKLVQKYFAEKLPVSLTVAMNFSKEL